MPRPAKVGCAHSTAQYLDYNWYIWGHLMNRFCVPSTQLLIVTSTQLLILPSTQLLILPSTQHRIIASTQLLILPSTQHRIVASMQRTRRPSSSRSWIKHKTAWSTFFCSTLSQCVLLPAQWAWRSLALCDFQARSSWWSKWMARMSTMCGGVFAIRTRRPPLHRSFVIYGYVWMLWWTPHTRGYITHSLSMGTYGCCDEHRICSATSLIRYLGVCIDVVMHRYIKRRHMGFWSVPFVMRIK